LRITGEVAIPQVEAEKKAAMEVLAEDRPDAIMHVGFGLGLLGMNAALEEIGWMPRRYTTTAFEFVARDPSWRAKLAGWVGLDQYDERNQTGQEFLDRFEARYGRRPEYFLPVLCYDVARVIMSALANARPLTGRGVMEALERVKMLPAASGAPGTRLRFGKFIRQGWVGSEYLVARRVLDDGNRHVMHGTIEGLVSPSESS
jgi:branched-chain amino acid transport system substrate-binding protein